MQVRKMLSRLEAVSLTLLQYLLAGSFSPIIFLLPSHPQMPTFSSRPKTNDSFPLYLHLITFPNSHPLSPMGAHSTLLIHVI